MDVKEIALKLLDIASDLEDWLYTILRCDEKYEEVYDAEDDEVYVVTGDSMCVILEQIEDELAELEEELKLTDEIIFGYDESVEEE